MVFTAERIRLIIETSCSVVHYKDDLLAILVSAGVSSAILNSAPPPSNPGWGLTKRELARHVVLSLAALPDNGGLGPLRRIVAQLADWHNFATAKDPERARAMVRQLNAEISREAGRVSVTTLPRDPGLRATGTLSSSAEDYYETVARLRSEFLEMLKWPEPRAAERGYRFQELVHALFDVAGLRPRKAYRKPGEEVDGSFVLDYDNYLLEARWQKDRVGAQDLSGFAGKVERKIDCTRGLFIAVNGFSPTGLTAFQQGKRPGMVLVEGVHIMHVLDAHAHLADLLRATLEAAATRGTILTPLTQLRL